MTKDKKSLADKALDAIGRAVLGPREDRGTAPADPRELDDKSNGGAK